MKHQLNTYTTKYIILNVLTFGFYFFFIQNKITNIVKQMGLTEDFSIIKRSANSSIIYLWCGIILLFIPYKISLFLGLAGILFSFIYVRMWALHTRKAIGVYSNYMLGIDYKPNAFLIVLFPGLYTVWAVNHVVENHS